MALIPEVHVGEIWEDCDKRMNGRRVKIIAVGAWEVVAENVNTGRRTYIAIRRMRPNSTGWKLVGEPK